MLIPEKAEGKSHFPIGGQDLTVISVPQGWLCGMSAKLELSAADLIELAQSA